MIRLNHVSLSPGAASVSLLWGRQRVQQHLPLHLSTLPILSPGLSRVGVFRPVANTEDRGDVLPGRVRGDLRALSHHRVDAPERPATLGRRAPAPQRRVATHRPGAEWFLKYLMTMSLCLGALQVFWLKSIAEKVMEVSRA